MELPISAVYDKQLSIIDAVGQIACPIQALNYLDSCLQVLRVGSKMLNPKITKLYDQLVADCFAANAPSQTPAEVSQMRAEAITLAPPPPITNVLKGECDDLRYDC